MSQPVVLGAIRLGSGLIVELRPVLQARRRSVGPHQRTQLHGVGESVLGVAEVQFVLGQGATSSAYALSGCSTCQFYCAVKIQYDGSIGQIRSAQVRSVNACVY